MKKDKKVVSKQAAAKPAKAPAKAKAPKTRVKASKPVAVAAEAAVVKPAIEMPLGLKLRKEQVAHFKKLLLDLRDHLIDGVNFLASDNLKRSNREASGELSGYSLHMADAGTDNFDREFALSLVSNEQDALYEIEEALKRLEGGAFGVCEMCEKQIRMERLEAVPFARMCVQCQSSMEKNRRRPPPVVGIFSENADDETTEAEESEE
jgi:RNA polymerase-binding protein DksA